MNDPSDHHSLDELLEVLQQPARPRELEQQSAVVDRMVAEMSAAPPQGATSMKTMRLTRRTAILAAVAVATFSGVAAAASGVVTLPVGARTADNAPASSTTVSESSTTTSVGSTSSTTSAVQSSETSTPTSTDSSTSTTAAPTSTTTTAAGSAAAAVECEDGNHGATVSKVAHETPPGPGHGAAVSAAAHSDCGKKGEEADDESESDDDEVESTPTTVASMSPTTVDGGQSSGKGKGKSGEENGESNANGAHRNSRKD